MAKEKGGRMSDDYNGWTNRETWAVMLHLDNDKGLYDEYHEMFKQVCKEEDLGSRRWRYADVLKEWVTEFLHVSYWSEMGVDMPELLINMQDDVGSLWRVNWDELAQSIIQDIEDEIEYVAKEESASAKEIKNGIK